MAIDGLFDQPRTWGETPSAVTATPTVQVGSRRSWKGDDYLYVYNAGGEQISPGLGCIYSAVTGYSVSVSSVTSVNPCVGVVKHATLTTATYGWVVTRGFVPLEADANTGLAVGDKVVLGTDGVNQRVTGATGYLANIHGYVTQATASAGSGYGYVNCM